MSSAAAQDLHERRRRHRRRSAPDSVQGDSTQQRRRSAEASRWERWSAAGVAALCLGLAVYLAAIHPLGALPALVGVAAVALLARYFWTVWPAWLLMLVPAVGFAPWTGWLWLEEWQMLVLASAAGGYAAIAGPHRHKPPPVLPVWRRELRWRATTKLLLMLWALSCTLAVIHGVVGAGGLDLYVFQGYHEAGQALRSGAPWLALGLMLPLWKRVGRRTPQTLTPSLTAGMLGVLLVISLGSLYERATYAGLFNFGQEYHTSSVFWEMHIGGGALDGALALALPFGLLTMLRAQGHRATLMALALLLLGLYALASTSSHGLYLGALLGLLLTGFLWTRQHLAAAARPDEGLPGSVWPAPAAPGLGVPWMAIPSVLALLTMAGMVIWHMFPSSGLRGALAVCGTLMALLVQPSSRAAATRGQRLLAWVMGLLLALPLVALVGVLNPHIDKIAYVAYTLAWSASLWMAFKTWRGGAPWTTVGADMLRAAAWLATVGLTAMIAWSWGGYVAFEAASLPLLLLALAWPLSQGGDVGEALARLGWRSRLMTLAALLVLATAVGVWVGVDHFRGPAVIAAHTFDNRVTHWARTAAIVGREGDEFIGVGAGRFPAEHALNAPFDERMGDYRVNKRPEPHITLSAGRLQQATRSDVVGANAAKSSAPPTPREMLRLTQRIADAPPDLKLRLQVRNARPITLYAEVCERHLLFVGACVTQEQAIPASHDLRTVTLNLGGQGQLGERGFPSRSLSFAVALLSAGTRADLTALSLSGSDGRELLQNGRFTEGTAHWFFTSDRNHLPWHAKNLVLHWYFEQGLTGLVLALTLVALALGRVCMGSAARHPLAPALAGALLGFFVVGLFDSLVDAARIAFLFGTLVLIALGLRAAPPPDTTPPLSTLR